MDEKEIELEERKEQFPKVVCNRMKPYVYQPLSTVPYKNGGEGIKMMENNSEGLKPSFDEVKTKMEEK